MSDDTPPSEPLGRPVRLAVLLSGSGTTLQNILDRIASGALDAEVRIVVSSRPGVRGIERAHAAGIDAVVVHRKQYRDGRSFHDALHAALESYDIDPVVLAGFMSLFEPRDRFRNRVMNIHPALIPAFSGAGFYGERVHKAVLAAGVRVSGCTVHLADDEYDHGPIIVQKTVPVLDDDTPDSLAQRVHLAENEAYPEAISLWRDGRLRLDGNRIRIAAA